MSQQQQQPYDSSIKTILNEDAPAILPLLLPGVEVLEVLDIEILRSPMRTDRVYRVLYRDKPHVFHLEFQASRDDKMAFRMAVYHTQLLEKAEVMPPLEKQRVQERLKMFDELLEQDEFVQKQRERGLQEGIQQGLQEGQIKAYQTMLVNIVKNKFPSLEDLAQRRAAQTRKIDALGEVIQLVSAVNDENMARIILNPSSAA